MLISFTSINLEISSADDFLEAFIDSSAELCNRPAFMVFTVENSSLAPGKPAPAVLLRAN